MAKKGGISVGESIAQSGSACLQTPNKVLIKKMEDALDGADTQLRAFGICLLNMFIKERQAEIVLPVQPKHPEAIHFDF